MSKNCVLKLNIRNKFHESFKKLVKYSILRTMWRIRESNP